MKLIFRMDKKVSTMKLKIILFIIFLPTYLFSQNLEEIKLTNRETEILEHLSKGLNYNSIADNLLFIIVFF